LLKKGKKNEKNKEKILFLGFFLLYLGRIKKRSTKNVFL
jgi:hypothetical protein